MFSGGAGRCLWDIWSDPWTVHWGASWGVPAQLLREATGIPLKGHSRTWSRFFQEQVDIMMCEGFSGHQLISQLHDHTVQYFINQWCLNIAMSRWKTLVWMTSRNLQLLNALQLPSTACLRAPTSIFRYELHFKGIQYPLLNLTWYPGDGSGHLHDENSGDGLNEHKGKGESDASLMLHSSLGGLIL